MRKALYMVCASALFAACSSSSHQSVENGAIVYDIAVSSLVKTSANAVVYDIEPAVWAIDAEDGDVFMDDMALVRQDDMLWSTESGLNWPDYSLEQYLYSPMGRAGFSPEGGICFADYRLDEGCQLYYTEQLDTKVDANSRGIVSVVMKNALCAVRFYACSSMPSYAKFIIRKVEFKGVYTAGSFNSLPTAQWTLDRESARDIGCFDSTYAASEYPALMADRTMMIPQEGTVELRVVCDVDADGIVLDNQEYECKIKVDWKPGKIYDYVIRAYGESDMKVVVEYFKDAGSGL